MSNDVMTVGDLKRELSGLNDNDKIHLPGGLSFYRLKRCADDAFFIEVNEPQAYLSEEYKKKNPQVKVAFIKSDDVEWNEEGTISDSINVELD